MIRMIRGDKGDEDDKGDKEKSVYSSIAKPWTPPVYSRSKEGTRSNTPTCREVGGFQKIDAVFISPTCGWKQISIR